MKKLRVALGLVMGTFLSAAPASAAIVISFAPSAQHVNIGDSVGIDVSISGLGAEILSAYDLNFMYNGTLLNWTSVSIFAAPLMVNFPLSTPADYGMDSIVEGNLGLYAFSLDIDADLMANQANSFQLFHFELKGMADGVTYFGLGLDQDFERNFVGLDFQSLNPEIGNACVGVGTGACPVPEPSSSALVALALAGLLVPRARRRSGPANSRL